MKLRVTGLAIALVALAMVFTCGKPPHGAPHSITLKWNAVPLPVGSNSASIILYTLQTAPTPTGTFVNVTGAVNISATQFLDAGLGPNVTKCYQVAALNHPPSGSGLVDSALSPFSTPPVCATTPIDPELTPNTPGGLAAVAQ